MTTIITTDFRAIHDALSKLIIEEVKAALRVLPEQKMEGEHLCHVVVSGVDEYNPVDATVTRVWIDGEGKLQFLGTVHGSSGLFAEDDDLFDITDFQYLIERMKDLMPDGKYHLRNKANLDSTDEVMPSVALASAIDKTIEY